MTNFEPFAIRLTFNNTNTKTSATGVPLGASLSNPYNAFVGGNPFPYKGTYISGGGIFAVDTNFQWPYSYQLNFSVQRQVTRNLAVTAGYVGTLSHNLPFGRDVNYPVLNSTATSAGANIQARRPNTAYGAVLLLKSDQTASYNGLQVTANMRMTSHVTFSAFYTFSKTLSSAELHNNTTQGLAQNYSILSEDRGRADTDQRHIFTASFNYQPDYYRGQSGILRNILNGWSISPIIKLRSGVPLHRHQRQRGCQPRQRDQ